MHASSSRRLHNRSRTTKRKTSVSHIDKELVETINKINEIMKLQEHQSAELTALRELQEKKKTLEYQKTLSKEEDDSSLS